MVVLWEIGDLEQAWDPLMCVLGDLGCLILRTNMLQECVYKLRHGSECTTLL
jgi:hypothetical protein